MCVLWSRRAFACHGHACDAVQRILCVAPFAVGDAQLMHNFSAAATDVALTFNAGFWVYSGDRPFPPWGVILQARLYTDPLFAPLRQQLMTKRFRATSGAASAGEVLVLTVEDHQDVTRTLVLRMYSPVKTAAVPSSVSELSVRMVLHHARPLRAAPPHVVAALAAGALTVVWGTAGDVAYVTTHMPPTGSPTRSVDVMYFIRSRLQAHGDHLCSSQVIRIMGHPTQFSQKVCT